MIGAWLCIYHLFVWSNFNFLHISQWITLPTQLCLVLYSFCANCCICWLCDWWFRLYHYIIYICYFVASNLFSLWFDLIWFVLTALFFAAIKRDSVSLLKFPFLSLVQVFSSEMLFISHLKYPHSCFSSHVCVLVIVILLSIVFSVSFLMAVISPPSCFSMSLYRYDNAVFDACKSSFSLFSWFI